MPPVVEAEPLSFAEPTRDGAVAEAHVLLERGAGHDSAGAPVLLAKLVKTSRDVAATRARLEKIDRLGSLLGRLTPHEIDVAVCLLAGRLRQGRIGLGGAGVRAARPDRPAPEATLGLVEVDEAFERIASLAGPGSSRERTRLLSVLLSRAIREELDFLVRLIAGELRQGALMAIMGEAVARAANVAPSDVRRALMLAGDLPAVARAALTQGSAGLAGFRLELLRPIQPMLAQPAEDLDDALTRLGEAALEYKLDGVRVQIHRSGEDVRVFSRRLKEVSHAVPELVEAVRRLPGAQLLLDGEVLALRPDGSPHPFQVTMRRFGRRLDVDRMREKLPLTPHFFDLLHLDGEDLFDRPASERFGALRQAAPDLLVPRLVTADSAAAASFLEQALGQGHEGVMAKATGAAYEAGSRGSSWLKVKPAHTLDLVVLAAEWGSGRRQGLLSNIHLGARDPATGGFVMLGKTFKGMTDAMLAWQTKRFQALAVTTEKWVVHLRPELVVEVAFSDVQKSPHYPGGMALRFARVRRYRPDKSVAEADTVDSVRAILNREPGP